MSWLELLTFFYIQEFSNAFVVCYLRTRIMTVSNEAIMIWIHLWELFSRIQNHNKTESQHQIAHLTVISMFVHGRLIK